MKIEDLKYKVGNTVKFRARSYPAELVNRGDEEHLILTGKITGLTGITSVVGYSVQVGNNKLPHFVEERDIREVNGEAVDHVKDD
ncbi:hypothetical protein F4X90_20370 [Candidatus Poribacteria bacterium]|nr:hypothetical protein [Candidatus Poribacteria bacterium]